MMRRRGKGDNRNLGPALRGDLPLLST